MQKTRAIFAAAGLALGLALAPEAAAQKDRPEPAQSAPVAATFVGEWRGVIDWNNDELDGPLGFTFNADGSFVDPYGESGSWRPTANGIRMEYPTGGQTVYVGRLIEDTIIGTMQTNPPTLNGMFTLRRN